MVKDVASSFRFLASFSLLVPLLLAVSSCRDDPGPAPEAAPAAGDDERAKSLAAAASAEQARGERVEKALNPRGLKPYAGRVGSVRGVVRVTGDPPPPLPEIVAKLPSEGCPHAREMVSKLFRRGPRGTLGDALVTVTRYQGYVPARDEAVRVDVRGCAFPSRTIAMTFGQRLDVYNHDEVAYMPRLVGAPTPVLRVAIEGRDPVPLFAPKPGQYALVEAGREYMIADVFVLSYPTFDVTDLDGEFAIEGVPVGPVTVNAYSPAMGKTTEREVVVEAGQAAQLELELRFSASEFEALRKRGLDEVRAQGSAPSPDPAPAGGASSPP